MRHRPFIPVVIGLLVIGMFLLSAASPHTAVEAALARSTQSVRLATTATALKATVIAGSTRIARTATALQVTMVVQATRAAGTATALRATLTPPATVSPDEAATAIQTYAETVLDITVSIKKAGGLTGTITRSLTQTPKGSTAQTATAKLSGKTCGAALSNGAASLSYGSGTISGDVSVDVQGSSLGVYSLIVPATSPLNADSALELARATFPGLADFKYTSYTVTKGYAWYFKGKTTGYDPKTKKIVTLAEAVILYVVPGSGGKASVSATVGRGDFASQVNVP